MPRPRLRSSVLGLMGLVVISALGLVGLRDWERHHGRGAPYWAEARRLEGLASRDLMTARKLRECPRQHTPWTIRYGCDACIDCPRVATGRKKGGLPEYEFAFTPDSERGRLLSKDFLQRHETVALEFEAEAATYRKLSDKFDRAADRPPEGELEWTPAEMRLRFGDTLSEKYRHDSY